MDRWAQIVDGLYYHLEKLGVKGHTVGYGGRLLYISCRDAPERERLWMKLRDGWHGIPIELWERNVAS